MREVVEHLFMLQGVLTPEMPMHVCHPKDKDLELARRFDAPPTTA